MIIALYGTGGLGMAYIELNGRTGAVNCGRRGSLRKILPTEPGGISVGKLRRHVEVMAKICEQLIN